MATSIIQTHDNYKPGDTVRIYMAMGLGAIPSSDRKKIHIPVQLAKEVPYNATLAISDVDSSYTVRCAYGGGDAGKVVSSSSVARYSANTIGITLTFSTAISTAQANNYNMAYVSEFRATITFS